jgi:hypothetical protein
MAEEGEDGVEIALAICGASDKQIESILREGFDGMRDLLILDKKEIANKMTAITRLPALNRGGHRIGAILTKTCKGLAYWCREQQRQGLDLDANRFTEEELKVALNQMAIEAIASETKPELPSKFEAQKWESWSKKVENHLSQVRGCHNTPLICVIRKARTP